MRLAATLSLFALFLSSTRALAEDNYSVDWSERRDVFGAEIASGDESFTVVCFLGVECPLARLYGPRLQNIANDYSKRGVGLIGVNSNPQDSIKDIREYASELEVAFPIIKDRDQSLARKFVATRTPEVFVMDAQGNIRYQGRIDDQYQPGIARAESSQHDLRNALSALLDGKQPPVAKTHAVGCRITLMEKPPTLPSDGEPVTFTKDVVPVLNRHCVECHREGEIGPFALTDYDEVVGWGEMMLEVIDEKRMPPWHADPQFGKFVGQRLMPKADRDIIANWIAQRMPEGDASDLPSQPKWPDGWHLPTKPDEQIVMRSKPFSVPAQGVVEYQYFVVDPKWKEDRWVAAAQVIPGNASVVHHAIVFVRPPDGQYSDGIGWLGAYVPGQRTGELPKGHARFVPAGSKLVFQMHYTPNGKEAEDNTKVGVWFRDAKDVTHRVATRIAIDQSFEIPPGAKDHTVNITLDRFGVNGTLLGASPHMHLRGKSFKMTLRRGDAKETLLHVPRYDFNWQHWYQLQTPAPLANVDAFELEVKFDNSSANPTNPAPNEYVSWGDQTWEEMAVAFFDIAYPRDELRRIKPRRTPNVNVSQIEREAAKIADKFMSQLDQNKDGVIKREETPEAFQRYGFREFDQDDNGEITKDEALQHATWRAQGLQ